MRVSRPGVTHENFRSAIASRRHDRRSGLAQTASVAGIRSKSRGQPGRARRSGRAYLLKREALGSTGIGKGVAIPHARLPGLQRPFGIFAKLRQPIAFDAIDGQAVDIVFVLLLPAAAESDALGALALVARTLRSPETLARLRGAKTASDLYALVA